MTSGGLIVYLWPEKHHLRPSAAQLHKTKSPKTFNVFCKKTTHASTWIDMNRRILKSLFIETRTEEYFILFENKIVNFQKPDMSIPLSWFSPSQNFDYLKALTKTKINLWKRSDSKRPQKKSCQKTDTKMVSAQPHWVNEASHYHRSQSE